MARHEVLTPVPGTFYRRPDPDSEPFLDHGDAVSIGDTVGLVEIMKNFQEVEAEVGGTLVEFLVGNEDAVEAGATIGLVEIMKNFQEVEAEVGGTLVEFLVGNEDAVQAGQPVAVIDDGS